MQVNERIDLIDLRQKTEDKLSVSLDEVKKRNVIDEVSFLLLSSGKEIPCFSKTNAVFSPVLLLDKVRQLYYPLFYFSPNIVQQDGQIYLSVLDSQPQLNEAGFKLLKDLNLVDKDSCSFSDLSSFVRSLSSLIESQRLRDKISLSFVFCFFDQSVLLYNSIYSFLQRNRSKQRQEEKYRCLFSEVREDEKEKTLNQENVGYFSKQERSLLRREQYQASLVSYEEKEVFDDFLYRIISSARKKNKSLLFVAEKEDKDELIEFFNRHHLLDQILKLEQFSFRERKKLFKNAEEEKREVESSSFLEERLESFEQKRDDCFLLPSFFQHDSRRKYLFSNEVRKANSYPLDAFSYTNREVEKDFELLNRIQSKEDLLSIDLTLHPFYGLESDDDLQKYDDLVQLLNSRLLIITSIQDLIHSKRGEYNRELNTFSQIEQLFDEMSFVERYDGFSLSLFTLSAKQSSEYPLTNLKKRFQAVSSIKLIVKDFFDESIFSSDIQNRVNLRNNPSYFERRKGKKRINRYLKNKENPDYDTLVKILNSYAKNYQLLQTNRPIYRKIYGDNRPTRSYVTESETRRNYVHEFEDREKKDSFFSFKNPFILHLYQDEDFRRSFLSSTKQLHELVNHFTSLRKTYRFYFPQTKDYSTLPLQECSLRLNIRQQGTYSQFADYSFFHKQRRSASWFRQKVRKEKYIDQHHRLKNFKAEFFHSLNLSYYQEGKKQFCLYQKDYDNLRKKKIEQALFYQKEDDSYLSSLILQNQLQNQKDIFYRDQVRRFTSNKVKADLINPEDNSLLETLSKRYPIRISDTNELGKVCDDCFDEVILLNSRQFNDVALLNGFRVGKSVLLLSPALSQDSRVPGLHYTLLNSDGIYRKVIDFSKIPESLIDLFQQNQEKYGYQFVLDDLRYPFRIKKEGKTDLGIFPSFLLESKVDRRGRNELNRYLNKELHFSLFYFHREEAFFDSDSFFFNLLK